jgi:hypothetical protein
VGSEGYFAKTFHFGPLLLSSTPPLFDFLKFEKVVGKGLLIIEMS